MDDLDAAGRIYTFRTRLRALSGVSRVVVRVHSGASKGLEIATFVSDQNRPQAGSWQDCGNVLLRRGGVVGMDDDVAVPRMSATGHFRPSRSALLPAAFPREQELAQRRSSALIAPVSDVMEPSMA